MSDPRKLYIKTYGCQMNVYDSERMEEALGPQGYTRTDTPEDADLILLNTCHIREKAAEKVYSELGRLKTLKAANPDLKIGVAGCVAQAEGAEIMARAPAVDLVVGPQSYHNLPALERQARAGLRALDTDFPAEDKFDHLPARGGRGPKARRAPTAFLTVQEGCDKFCAFCVVPYTRGAEVSRPVARVLSEAEDLVERGVREITLLGQNVNAYHGQDGGQTWGLARLVRKLAEIDGLERIRFTTSHPNDMDDDLIAAHRAARPDILISGDFIVGFPEETAQDFEDTMELVRKVKYGQAFSFKYSARPGTPAAERADVDAGEADDRLQRLQALLRAQQAEVQQTMVGREVSVLFEKPGRLPGQMVGKSDYLHAVHAITDAPAGTIARVRIVESSANSLAGEVVNDPA